uniref:Uncharacterized protein n=1 Tax=Utricularia reniformis TaxID=192314 RepID=A0A1Y0AZH2_9LAMI|nr:hypothetical protein AEK19_MT0307 [Utricularia reniformis]ART30582.1 hypothetical protein AEK19_MT0307 [Utricularia reniformis]
MSPQASWIQSQLSSSPKFSPLESWVGSSHSSCQFFQKRIPPQLVYSRSWLHSQTTSCQSILLWYKKEVVESHKYTHLYMLTLFRGEEKIN